MFADGECVEQSLSGVFVGSVACVDDACVEAFCEELGCACGAMAENDDVGVEGLEVFCGIEEGFAFLEARGGSGDIDDVGTEAECGKFKGDAGAGAWFNEEVNEGPAAEGGNFFEVPFAYGFEGRGSVED